MFELALALGVPHPDYLLEMLTSQQITEWLEFYKLRPFGFVRESSLFGTLAALQYNAHLVRGRPKSPFDFFPVEVADKDSDGRDSPERIIKLFQQYNLDRGYPANGHVKHR